VAAALAPLPSFRRPVIIVAVGPTTPSPVSKDAGAPPPRRARAGIVADARHLPEWRRHVFAWLRQAPGSSRRGVAGIVLLSLVPLLGVLAFGWGIYAVAMFYWVECNLIGVTAVLKLAVRPPSTIDLTTRRALAIALFVVVYGALMLATLGIVTAAFASDWVETSPGLYHMEYHGTVPGWAVPALLLLLVQQALLFIRYCLVSGPRRASTRAAVLPPFGRTLLLLLGGLVGAGFSIRLGTRVPSLVLLVFCMAGADVLGYLLERRAEMSSSATVAPPVSPA
jgi:hypothetical protein